jgi:hypothetical protein
MNYALIYILSFIMIGSAIQKLIQTQTARRSHKPTSISFQNKESWLIKSVSYNEDGYRCQ